jgi:hypothetical protein
MTDSRFQFLELLAQLGFVPDCGYSGKEDIDNWLRSTEFCQNSRNDNVVHAVVCAGLYANVAHVVRDRPDTSPNLWHRNERLYFHPNSVNHKKKDLPSDWIIFHEKFATGRTTVSATSPVLPSTLILFGGSVVVKHFERKVVVDDWIELDMAAQTGVRFRQLRKRLDEVLQQKIRVASDAPVNDVETMKFISMLLQECEKRTALTLMEISEGASLLS